MADTKTLRLMSLDVENVLRLKAVSLKMGDDNVLIIEGPNESGKSSALKCVEMMFAGGKVIPPEPLHGDAKKGHIIARVGALIATQKFRAGNSPQFWVTMENGKKIARPREVMAAMCNTRTLDPVKFLEMKPEEQSAMMAKFAHFDAAEFDEEYAKLFDERKWAKKEAKAKMSAMNEAPSHTNAPAELVDVKELMEEARKRREHNQSISHAVIEAQRTMADYNGWCNSIHAMDEEMTILSEKLGEMKEKHAEMLTTRDRKAGEVSEAQTAVDKMARMDVDEIETQIAQADDLNRKRRDNDRHAELRAEASAAEAKWDKLEEDLKALAEKKDKARLEASKKVPVPDLELTDDGLFYKGKPFSQAGRSAQLRVSTAVAIALNKDSTVRVLLIDDGEKLDANGKRIVLEMAAEADFQVMMTRVLREGPVSEGCVLIEDGRIGDA